MHKILADWDFYPRSPCGERRAGCGHVAGGHQISIHALLAESDPAVIRNSTAFSVFLSTLSLRRATGKLLPAGILRRYFYPRSPCGERLCDNTYTLGITDISIHALLAESDDTYVVMEATKVISIHALLAESDLDRWLAGLKGTLFLSTLSLRRATEAINPS